MKTPNITPAQIIGAVFGGLYPLMTLLGVELSVEQVDALQQLDVIAVGLFGADAAIRVGRSVGTAKGTLEPPLHYDLPGGDEIAPGELSEDDAAEAESLEDKQSEVDQK